MDSVEIQAKATIAAAFDHAGSGRGALDAPEGWVAGRCGRRATP